MNSQQVLLVSLLLSALPTHACVPVGRRGAAPQPIYGAPSYGGPTYGPGASGPPVWAPPPPYVPPPLPPPPPPQQVAQHSPASAPMFDVARLAAAGSVALLGALTQSAGAPSQQQQQAYPPAQPPAGWVMLGGIPVPAIPGVTVAAAPSPPVPSPAPSSAPTGPAVPTQPDGAEKVVLDRWHPAYGIIPGAAQMLVNHAAFSAEAAATLPPRVDHRTSRTEGPVRNQRSIGACTAFSLAAAMDNSILRSSADGADGGGVSVMHLWSRYHAASMRDAYQSNLQRAVTREAVAQWNVLTSHRACGWTNCGQGACSFDWLWGCGKPVDADFTSTADASPYAVLDGVTEVPFTTPSLRKVLASGDDVWVSLHWSDKWELEGYKLAITSLFGGEAALSDQDATGETDAHAFVLAGYRDEPDGTYFLVHNSWGKSWGNSGYAWMRERTLLRNATGGHAYVVRARLSSSPRPSTGAPSTCAPPALPDSGTKQCAPQCPGGGARHFGVCPVAGQCPAGQVNLSGTCVVSPGWQSGHDPQTGIDYACTPQGCLFTMKYGQHGCQTPYCVVTCAAPAYLLSVGQDGLSCST